MKKTEYSALTNETIETQMSEEEIEQLEKDQANDAAAKAIANAEANAKATAKEALLTKLGITAEEAVLLLS